MDEEQGYIAKRVWKAKLQSIPFYLFRVFPIQRKKIVFCCIEGTTGYSCNPKYIAEELIRRKKKGDSTLCHGKGYEFVWLVDDVSKHFPKEIKVVKNTLWNRAYHLSTAKIWVDNSRKQLEVRKRKGQIYIQTWHAKLGFKPTCLDRGESFSKIAYLVSKHDSDMIDYVLSNSKWYDDTLPTGMLYNGPILRTGSPRCDILVNDRTELRKKIRKTYNLPQDAKVMMYAPTFRGGSQETVRTIGISQEYPNYEQLINILEKRFGGTWYIFLRLHPQLVARNMDHILLETTAVIDVSRMDDMYELLAGCDAFMTDYSSAAFDAAVMEVPVWIYANDYTEYEKERGKLLWDIKKLPFPLALDNEELGKQILNFDEISYKQRLEKLFHDTEMMEDGKAAEHVADKIEELT